MASDRFKAKRRVARGQATRKSFQITRNQGVLYKYDPEGMRVATLAGGAVTAEYLYDKDSNLVTTVNGQGQLVRSILRDNGGTHLYATISGPENETRNRETWASKALESLSFV